MKISRSIREESLCKENNGGSYFGNFNQIMLQINRKMNDEERMKGKQTMGRRRKVGTVDGKEKFVSQQKWWVTLDIFD